MATEQEFYQDIRYSLGDLLIDVELEDAHIDYAYRMAKRTHIQKGNNNADPVFYALQLEKDKQVYAIDTDIHTVVRIIRGGTGYYYNDDPMSMAVFNDIFRDMGGNTWDLLTYDLSRQLMDRIRQYAVHDLPFIFRPNRNEIEILKQINGDEGVFLEAYKNLSDTEYRDNLWIFEWTKAECKEILGNAYRKFNQLSAPSGDTSLDGSSMIQEAKQQKEKLLDEIMDYTDGEPAGGVMFMG